MSAKLWINIFLFISFLFIVLFGLTFSMPMNEHGQMISCPLMTGHDNGTFCPMSGNEHITAWQRLFITPRQQDTLLSFILLLVFGVIALLFQNLTRLRLFLYLQFKLYQKDHPDSLLFNYLQIVFSRGILQPKIYA